MIPQIEPKVEENIHTTFANLVIINIFKGKLLNFRNKSIYLYGTGGKSFAKSSKVSKFDEDKELVYSPGPAKYVPRVKRNTTMFSFGKEKKDFSFVKKSSKDIPSPGKYKIKRDFLSKKSHRA